MAVMSGIFTIQAAAAVWGWICKIGAPLGKALGKFFETYWRQILAVVFVSALCYHFYTKGYETGKADANLAWVTKYNATVSELKARLKALTHDSVTVGDKVEDASDLVKHDLVREEERVADIAAKHAQERTASGTICPNKIDLNGELPKEFFESWNRTNAIGQHRNPYEQEKQP